MNRPTAARILEILAANPTQAGVTEAGDEFGLLDQEVLDLATKYGWPRPASMTRAAEILRAALTVASTPPSPAPKGTAMQSVQSIEPIARLLNEGEASSRARIRNKASRVRDLLDDLEAALEGDREAEKARKEVERLEAQLRAAKSKLRGGAAKPERTGPPAAEVRSWAKSNGVTCPDVGRVPRSVVDAYESAQAS